MDEAGQNAVSKSVRTCLEKEMDTEIIVLPKGFKDVNDLVVENPQGWEKAIKEAQPVMDYFFNAITGKYDRNNPKGKRLIAYEFLNIIKHINDPIERSYWINKLAEDIQVEEDALTQVLEKVKVDSVNKFENKSSDDYASDISDNKRKETKTRMDSLQERLLGLFSLYQEELKKEAGKIDESLFDKKYLEIWEKINKGEFEEIKEELGKYEIKVKYGYDDKAGFSELEVDPMEEWNKTLNYLILEKKKKQLSEIFWDIKKAEKEGDEESLEFLMENLRSLSEELNREDKN
jgi:DNA primase